MSTKKTATKKPAGKPSRAHSSNPGTAMRAHGHVLIQTWASKELQAALRDYAKKTKKYISDILREVIGREAEKWSGATAGSLQVLRKGNGNGKAGKKVAEPASKVAAKSAAKSKSKQKVAKSAKGAAKVVAKSAKKAASKAGAARHSTNSKSEVVAAGAAAESAAQGAQVET